MMDDSGNSLRGCKPLSDPVHLYSRLVNLSASIFFVLLTAGICYLVFLAISERRGVYIAGSIVVAVGTIIAILPVAGIRLLLKRGTYTAIYLRAFRLDESSRKIFRLLRTAFGESYNLCGIRAPRFRTPLWIRLTLGLAVALRYVGSERYQLEASEDDWMPRLLVSLKGARFAVIDIRCLTDNVERELELALLALDPEHCIVTVDNSRPEDEWRELLSQLEHAVAANAESLRLVSYSEGDDSSDAQFIEQVETAAESAPLRYPAVNEQAIEYVKSITNEKCWHTPFLRSDMGIVVLLLAIGLLTAVPILFILGRYPWSGSALIYIVLSGVLCLFTLAWKRSYSIAKFASRHGRDSKQSGLRRLRRSLACVVAYVVILATIQFIILPGLARVRTIAFRMACGTNLSALGKAMLIYANDYDDKLPTANKWCDLLTKWGEISAASLHCSGAVEGTCHYAMNKHVIGLSYPGDQHIVLLFEAPDGWNQVGGAELLTTDHHQGEGCNVLFMDLYVEFVKSSQIPNLRWK